MTSAMKRRQRHASLPRAIQRAHDGVLPAAAELAARVAVGDDLLRDPLVRDDRKPEVNEIRRRVRERAQLLEARGGCARDQLVDDPPAETKRARLATDNHRS